MSTTATTEEQIKKMYESQLNSQKEQLTTDYQNANSKLDEQIRQNEKAADKNLNRTAVEALKAAVSNEEYYNASGLSSGARAQARLSQENQALANMTAIRTAQQEADAQVERSRSLLAKEYESAIRKAQADNDMELAKALYERAKQEEERLRAEREAAASLMAQSGDYTRYGELYGLSPQEVSKLNNSNVGGTGTVSGKRVQNWDNGGYDKETVKQLQNALGFTGKDVDGLWGPKSQAAAMERWNVSSVEKALAAYEQDSAKTGSFRDPAAGGGSSYAQVLADMQALKANGRTDEIGRLLNKAKAYLTASEYMVLYNKYRDGRL